MTSKPKYCTNKVPETCWDCPFTNYGRDCHNVSISAREQGAIGGAIGGRSKSEAKRRAAIENGKKGGRRKAAKPEA